ncbi:MAG: SRPBCC family protein [Pseudomonadota bacterium]
MTLKAGVVLGLAFAIAAVLPTYAEAHGPTRQKVTEKIEINAPVDKVWAVIGSFQDMNWHPAVEKTEGEGDNTPGATRTLTLTGGAPVKEILDRYSAENHMLKYRITEVSVDAIPVTNYSSTLSAEDADGKTVVTWRGAFYRGYPNNDPPENLNDAAAIKAVTGIYKAGLSALKASMEAGG